ncbi:MAG: hypothetical protein JJ895_14315 [Balneolaceae bacterium]|nr:hypothetical protein [Balneolaceae bacterium]
MGDLNTMGLNYYPSKTYDIPAEGEVAELHRKCRYRAMKVLSKTHPFTYNNGSQSSYKPANLDHIVAADHLKFKQFDGNDVALKGWTEFDQIGHQDTWIKNYSDHALLYFEVEK